MPSAGGPHGGHGTEFEALLREVVDDGDSERSAACNALASLVPTLDELAALIKENRGADVADVFLVSLRVDTGKQAAKASNGRDRRTARRRGAARTTKDAGFAGGVSTAT